jgi:urease accessory protein
MRANRVVPHGEWAEAEAVDRVLIDHDRRHRRRIVLRTESGRDLLLDLPQATRLKHGDGLVLDDGGTVRVEARPESLLEIHAHDEGELVRIAWHLGNRHLPVQLLGSRIRIRADHVIAGMVEGLGGHVEAIEAPFDPEAGAYADHQGCLRLLRRPDDLEDFAVEVAPVNGTLLAFPNGPTSWHGHKPFVGRRYSVQLNYMTTDAVARSELRRHRLSALMKRLTRAA